LSFEFTRGWPLLSLDRNIRDKVADAKPRETAEAEVPADAVVADEEAEVALGPDNIDTPDLSVVAYSWLRRRR
jgi:hypothetical protein